jgi:hypothetical protein
MKKKHATHGKAHGIGARDKVHRPGTSHTPKHTKLQSMSETRMMQHMSGLEGEHKGLGSTYKKSSRKKRLESSGF